MDASLKAVRTLIRVDELTESELLSIIELYENYQTDFDYIEGALFKYMGQLYKVIQDHTSLENWRPNELPALYLNLLPSNIIPEWVQPAGAHDAYQIGAQVIFMGSIYVSTVDNNTWVPGEYGWVVLDNEIPIEPDPVDPEEPIDPETPEVLEWAQPTGAHDAYDSGDRVRYNEIIYISTVNANTWRPDEYGWVEFNN